MTWLEQVEQWMKADLAKAEQELAVATGKKNKKYLVKKIEKLKKRIVNKEFEGDPPEYIEAMQRCNRGKK